MLELLSNNIPECIREDVAQGLLARLKEAEILKHLTINPISNVLKDKRHSISVTELLARFPLYNVYIEYRIRNLSTPMNTTLAIRFVMQFYMPNKTGKLIKDPDYKNLWDDLSKAALKLGLQVNKDGICGGVHPNISPEVALEAFEEFAIASFQIAKKRAEIQSTRSHWIHQWQREHPSSRIHNP
mgnify:CR=1 FL=1